MFTGAGFGCFQAVDFALLMDVLPEEKDKAKDIAVWSQVSSIKDDVNPGKIEIS